MKRTDLFVLIFFALFSIILAGWILVNPHNVGTGDWDQHFLYYGAPRITILEYRQFPLWNPYYCGGSPLLANAQSVFLNPFFLFILLFGEVLGIKIIILLHVFIGLLGMWLLAFHLGARKLSAVLAAVLFTGSSWLPLHLYEGHSIFIAMAYVPFAVLFYLKSYSSLRNVIFSAFFLALMSFSGSTPYALFFTIVLLSCHFLLRLLKNRRVSESRVIVMVFALAFLFSAVKVLPLLEFNHYSGFEATNEQPITIRIIIDSLISRNQYGLHRSTVFISENLKLPFGWHEYGAYIGIIPLALFLLSFVFLFRKYPEWIALSIIFLVLAFGNELFLWPLLHSLPLFKSLHVPSRFIILFVFCCSLLSSLLLSRFEKKNGLLVAFVVFIVSVDLLLVSIPIYKNTFAKSFEQPATKSDFTQVAATNMYTMQYQNLLQNRGTVNCYERMHPDIRAYPKFRDDGAEFIGYVGEAYVAETNQTLGYSQFSPNVVAVRTQGTTGTLVVNQNYYPGWRSSGKEVRSHNGLLSVHVDKNDSVVEFYYLPSSFIIGLIITAISFTGTLCIFLRKPHPK